MLPGTATMTDNDEMPGKRVAAPARTVLIVEDSEQSAAPLEMAAEHIPGVAVLVAPSGVEALRILADANRNVQVVITDLNMPRMDGFELIARIRADARLGRLPIIVVSADTDPSTPERIGRLGADAFFAKPYSPAQVCRKLEQLLDASTD
jgi:two-component system, chemotaxis family, chemotaxis protein CheY